MMFAPLASAFQFGSLLEWASRAALVVLAWTHVRSAMQQEPLEELTFRLQHPAKWAAQHPLKAALHIGRKIKP